MANCVWFFFVSAACYVFCWQSSTSLQSCRKCRRFRNVLNKTVSTCITSTWAITTRTRTLETEKKCLKLIPTIWAALRRHVHLLRTSMAPKWRTRTLSKESQSSWNLSVIRLLKMSWCTRFGRSSSTKPSLWSTTSGTGHWPIASLCSMCWDLTPVTRRTITAMATSWPATCRWTPWATSGSSTGSSTVLSTCSKN